MTKKRTNKSLISLIVSWQHKAFNSTTMQSQGLIWNTLVTIIQKWCNNRQTKVILPLEKWLRKLQKMLEFTHYLSTSKAVLNWMAKSIVKVWNGHQQSTFWQSIIKMLMICPTFHLKKLKVDYMQKLKFLTKTRKDSRKLKLKRSVRKSLAKVPESLPFCQINRKTFVMCMFSSHSRAYR